MSKKYYVIWKGEKTGVFDNWPLVKQLTAGRADAQYMGFPSKAEAEAAFASTYSKALMKRSLAKNPNQSLSGANTKSSAIKASTAKSAYKSAPANRNHADINIYCDGACSPNPGKSGTGMAVYQKSELTELWYGLHQAMGTNNTAELNGMLEAMRYAAPHAAKGMHIQILSDSKYSIDCITKWAKGWKNKGWTRGKGEEIKNLAIIQECFSLYEQLKANLTITHVKGHANIEGNELSDRMAVYARVNKQQGFVKYTDNLDIQTILAMESG
ncbi:ribonuclease H family protein [Thalassomonas sp. M1454]|uniref:ribonuclease H family protein n=1 Tax=Thalassomonas sp. M1454 TaxID=2594477 RepID=UPI00117CC7F5|nr:ribonuclease H family protein [Thalassomonas sp. M1454]TRX53929.1 ribonuclease HI [Thalassomonas sp. M1454]